MLKLAFNNIEELMVNMPKDYMDYGGMPWWIVDGQVHKTDNVNTGHTEIMRMMSREKQSTGVPEEEADQYAFDVIARNWSGRFNDPEHIILTDVVYPDKVSASDPPDDVVAQLKQIFPTAIAIVSFMGQPHIVRSSITAQATPFLKVSCRDGFWLLASKPATERRSFYISRQENDVTICGYSASRRTPFFRQTWKCEDRNTAEDIISQVVAHSELSGVHEILHKWADISPRVVKAAQSGDEEEHSNTKTNPYVRDYYNFVADIDRYRSDKYEMHLSLREIDRGYSVGCHVNATHLGLVSFQRYWHYKNNEKAKADKVFEEVEQAIKDTVDVCTAEQPPMTAVVTRFRVALANLDLGHQEKSGVMGFNWYLTIPQEPDWTSSLYGGRYPSPDIGTLGDMNWNFDEQSKEVTQEGNDSRNVVYRYTYDLEKNADVSAAGVPVIDWIGRHWRATIPLAGVLAFYTSTLHLSPDDLKRDVAPYIEQSGQIDNSAVLKIIEQRHQEGPEIEQSMQMDQSNQPRGIRNNNPGNIEMGDDDWNGMVEGEDHRFITFESPEYGIRAMTRILRRYQERGVNTVQKIIGTWAPSAENDVEAYVEHFNSVGIETNQELGLFDQDDQLFQNEDTLVQIISVIIKHENGENPYDEQTIRRGIRMELPQQIGGSSYRQRKYAYEVEQLKQKMHKHEARNLMEYLIQNHFGLNWSKVGPELIRRGVPRTMMREMNRTFNIWSSGIAQSLYRRSIFA